MLLKSFILVLKSRNSKVETNTEWCKVSIEISDPLRKTPNFSHYLDSFSGRNCHNKRRNSTETNCQTQKDQVVCNCFKYYVVPVFLLITPRSHKVAERENQMSCCSIELFFQFFSSGFRFWPDLWLSWINQDLDNPHGH